MVKASKTSTSFCKVWKAVFWESCFRKETCLKKKKIPQPNIRNLLMKYQASTHYSQMLQHVLLSNVSAEAHIKFKNYILEYWLKLMSFSFFWYFQVTAIHFPRETMTWSSREHWEQCQPPLPRAHFLNLIISYFWNYKKIKHNVVSFCQPKCIVLPQVIFAGEK